MKHRHNCFILIFKVVFISKCEHVSMCVNVDVCGGQKKTTSPYHVEPGTKLR